MSTPVCICNGVIRSGSTWSFNVCRELYQLDAIRNKKHFGSAYLDSDPLERFFAQPMPIGRSAVLKAHNLGPNAITVVRSGQARAVCTFRDPRDCVASDIAFMRYPMEASILRVAGTLGPIQVYQTTSNILLVRYEDMMKDRLRQIRRIAAHLEISIDENMARQVDAKTNLDASQRICSGMRQKSSGGELLKIADHLVDPTTHLHENHLNGGTVGRWRVELTIDQAKYLTEYFGPWLVKLGYETADSVQAMLSTSYSAVANSSRLQSIPPMGSFTVGNAVTTRFA